MLLTLNLLAYSTGTIFGAEDSTILVIKGAVFSIEKPCEGDVVSFSILVENQGTQPTTGAIAPALVRDWNQASTWARNYTQPIRPGETAMIPLNAGIVTWVAEGVGVHDFYADLTYNGVRSARWHGKLEVSGILPPIAEYNPPERPQGYLNLTEWPSEFNTGCDYDMIDGNLYGPVRDTEITFPSNWYEGIEFDGKPFTTYRLGYGKYVITEDNAIIENKRIFGGIHIQANNVTIRNCYIEANNGFHAGVNVNASGIIEIASGKSAIIQNCELNGLEGVHAGIWNQGSSLVAVANNIYNTNDGIFHWKSAASPTDGDNFRIEDNYIHNLTRKTANGHADGFQTGGSCNGLILHNYFDLDRYDNACIAIWNTQNNSGNILIQNNLLNGGGFAVYSHDTDDLYSVINTWFYENAFSTKASPTVGNWGIWYHIGPTDGWNDISTGKSYRYGNYILETGQNADILK